MGYWLGQKCFPRVAMLMITFLQTRHSVFLLLAVWKPFLESVRSITLDLHPSSFVRMDRSVCSPLTIWMHAACERT